MQISAKALIVSAALAFPALSAATAAFACEQGEIRCMSGSRMVCQCDYRGQCSWGPASGSCYRDDSQRDDRVARLKAGFDRYRPIHLTAWIR